MTTDSIINQIRLQSPKGLAKTYEGICEEYRKRLCAQWDVSGEGAWWIPSDRVGEVLAVNDCEFSFGMDDLRLIVDRCISFEDFSEYWEHVLDISNAHPISCFNWFVNGIRPKKE